MTKLPAERVGTIEDYDNGFWLVRHGPSVVDVTWFRPHEFRGIKPRLDMKVKMRYEVTPSTGLWVAYEEITS